MECGGITVRGLPCRRSGYLRTCCQRCSFHCYCVSKRIYKRVKNSNFNPGELGSDSEEEFVGEIPDADDVDFIAPEGDPEREEWTDDEVE